MTDKEYRELVEQDISRIHEYYAQLVKYYHVDAYPKELTWLQIMGLIETWDVKCIKYDR